MTQTKKRTSLILLSIILTFGILSCSPLESQRKVSQKVIGIIVYDGVLTSDVTAPYEVFGAAIKEGNFPYKVMNISIHEKKEITTYEGLKLFAESNIFDNLDLDVLIVPSTYDMKPLINNAKLVSFIKRKGAKATWLASNCAGAFLLGKAGFLDNHKATTWFGGEKELKKDYPACDVQFDRTVVVDGKLITSNGGVVSYEAALILLKKLTSPQFAKNISDTLQFTRVGKTKLQE